MHAGGHGDEKAQARGARKLPAGGAPLLVVGLGASAGGLEALTDFFKAMPADSGFACVVIQHLEPDHESQMAAILAKHTRMRVVQAGEGMAVQANCVYTIPPGKYLSIRLGRLCLIEPQERHGMRMAIDFFFRSLAEDQRERAVCVVLSGSGSDGTSGVRAVRAAGGLCLAQDPATAQFGIMPQSAIDSGLVDSVLPPDRMPPALVAFARHPLVGRSGDDAMTGADPASELDAILKLLNDRTGSDWQSYKRGTVVRRIERRIGLRQAADMADYRKLLLADPQELNQLAKDMQIGVTAFFRDPEAFAALRELALRPLVAGKSPDAPLRVWVPGCATGEEAYTVAMLLLEEVDAQRKGHAVQVFASDVDEEALDAARGGTYRDAAAGDVSAERLERFFVSRTDGRLQVGKRLREAVVFARQNMLTDPPFAKIDLITCRNVLIYLQPEAQRKVFSVFSFALNVGGYLFLGKTETLADPRELFETVSKPRRIYRLARANRHAADLPVFPGAGRSAGVAARHVAAPVSAAELTILNQQMLLEHFGAGIVLVEQGGRILHFYGQTEKYLGHPKGEASLNLFDLATGRLSAKLRRAMDQAVATNQAVAIREVAVDRKGRLANVTVTPAPGRAGDARVLAVILEDAPAAAGRRAPRVSVDEPAVAQLEAEVLALRSEIEETTQEHATASEELKAANEEMMSMNEEMQATNEELETSKEELQSINEELGTVNNQLTEKVGELTDANNVLANLFAATEIATVFLDVQLRIKRFTPRATELLNLIPADVGRPLRHITQNFDGQALAADAVSVLKDLVPIEKEVQMPDGRWHTMRVLPYRTLDNRIDGVVVTFADVSRLKHLEASLSSAKAYAESIVATVREPLLVLDAALRVVSANTAFYKAFRTTAPDTVGRRVDELGGGEWNVAALRGLLEEIVPARREFHDYQLDHDFPGLGPRTMRLNARRMEAVEDRSDLILLAIEDVTEREQARRQIEAQAAELERRVGERTVELARTVAELERVYDTAPAGLAFMDTELRFVRINERLAAMNGRPVAAHIGRTFRDVAPHVADAMEGAARQVLTTGEALLNMEGSGLIPGRGCAHWLASYLPVKDSDGTVVGISGMVLDVTERRQAEDRASATNLLLALISRESSRAGYLGAVVNLLRKTAGCGCVGVRLRDDRNGVPYEASEGFSLEFLESESRLLLDRDTCACTRVIAGKCLPCDAASMTPAGSFVCNDTAALAGSMQDEEKASFRGVCIKNGFASVAVVPIRYQETVMGAIQLADERPDRLSRDVVAFVESISPLVGEVAHRFDVESKLEKSEERYRSLVVATTQIVWTTNAQGEVAADLPTWRAYTGQTQEEIQGRGWAGALHPEDRSRVTGVWSRAVETRSRYDTEYRIRRADGAYRDFVVCGVPIAEGNGSIREWVGTCTDITARKQAEREILALNESLERRVRERTADLARSNKDLEQFAYVASHDLREPLRMVSAFTGLLQERYRDQLDAKAQKYMGFAVDASARMQQLIEDLLAYSRVGRDLTASATEVAAVVDAALQALQIAIEESGAVITREPLPTMQSNALELTQVFQNLIGNAIKFRRPGAAPEVHIGAKKVTGHQLMVLGRPGSGADAPPDPMTSDAFWLFSVRDNGIGIPDGQFDRVFDVFQRLHRRDEYPGTGIGLAICKKIVERHGGRIWVESEPGKGSTFWFALPG